MKPKSCAFIVPIAMLVFAFTVTFTLNAQNDMPPDSTDEHHVEIARRVIEELWNEGNVDSLDELYADILSWHLPNSPRVRVLNTNYWRDTFSMLHDAYPDMTITLYDVAANDDMVFAHIHFRGTRLRPVETPEGHWLPFSGEVDGWEGVFIYRIEQGKIVEEWWYWDNNAFAQLDVHPIRSDL